MPGCETTTDFIFPLSVDIYYPIVSQGGYGDVKRQWVFDRSVSCFFTSPSSKTKEDILPEAKIVVDTSIVGRVRADLTQSSRGTYTSTTNILLTNIRDRDGNIIYNESSGPRVGLATVFEVATFTPVVGPLGSTEYYKVVLRRSENQAVDV
jgi:hypothetical protein